MEMKKTMLLGFAASMAMIGVAKADPVDLSAYVDKNGFIDVQTLTCAQLANTYQEDANALTSWYSGWYNGLANTISTTRRAARPNIWSLNIARRTRTRRSFTPLASSSRTCAPKWASR
jgi:hypothetical protein